MNCVILGDKYQCGMKSQGCSALIKINKNINNILHQYNALLSIFGENINILYVYGFDSKKFIEFYEKSNLKIKLIYNEKYNSYNEAFSLSLVKNYLSYDNTFIINGYQKINKILLKKIDNNKSYIFINKNHHNNSETIGCIINKKNLVESLSIGLDNSIYDMYYLNNGCSKSFFDILDDKKNYNNFIFELLNKTIDSGYEIHTLVEK